MPRYEIDIDEKGELLETPAELKALFERAEIAAYGNGVRNGQGKAAEDGKKALDEALKAERAKWDAQMPLEREKWSQSDAENKALKSQLLDLTREQQKTLQQREDTHAAEILKRSEALKLRDGKISALVTANLKALAAQFGAREESLPELEVILGSQIGFDDSMDPYVKGPDGQPRLLQGKQMSVDAFVKDYLDTHAHHRKVDNRRGGGAQGGATYRGYQAPTSDRAVQRIHEGDRSADAINDLFQATRKKERLKE